MLMEVLVIHDISESNSDIFFISLIYNMQLLFCYTLYSARKSGML